MIGKMEVGRHTCSEGRRREWWECTGILKAESFHCGVMAAWLFPLPEMILRKFKQI